VNFFSSVCRFLERRRNTERDPSSPITHHQPSHNTRCRHPPKKTQPYITHKNTLSGFFLSLSLYIYTYVVPKLDKDDRCSTASAPDTTTTAVVSVVAVPLGTATDAFLYVYGHWYHHHHAHYNNLKDNYY
jgi:hypothetical protein